MENDHMSMLPLYFSSSDTLELHWYTAAFVANISIAADEEMSLKEQIKFPPCIADQFHVTFDHTNRLSLRTTLSPTTMVLKDMRAVDVVVIDL